MENAIVYFDGVCNFCNGAVNFLLKADKRGYFRYAALQSEAGRQLCETHGLSTDQFETFYLFENGRLYSRSTAALHVARRLGWKYAWLYVFIIVPAWFRDTLVYNPIARNRYRLFGKKDTCMIPTPEIRARFLN
jgi:predicted DCC family thiol-disulfide oxidoreductase YuxK